MLIPVLLFIVGLLCLIKGGDWFVDGATGIARRFHVPELLIGATVVSIGTTLPEVMVSTTSALTGHGEIAYGNAIGSIICNASLIAAITIAVKPGKVDPKTLRVPVAFFFAAAAIYCVAAYAMGEFTRPLGFVMLAMFVAYMVANVLQMKKAPAAAEAEAEAENAGEEMSLTKTLVLLVLGAVLIALGANLLVDNGTLIAQALGVPESVIALTFVALGTSLPELVTAITSLINIAATVIGMTIIDRVGRKPMLLAGSVGMVVAQGGLTVLFGTAPMVGGSPVLGPVSGPLALVCANLFVVAFGVTWGTTSWVMLSEMFPNTMRGAGMAVGTATQWLSNFVVTVSFPVLLGINVGLVYGLFAFFAFVSFFFALKCMHETKGVALEDMRA